MTCIGCGAQVGVTAGDMAHVQCATCDIALVACFACGAAEAIYECTPCFDRAHDESLDAPDTIVAD